MSSDQHVSKFIRDPVHDIIRIQHPFILELLNTKAMQRLRRIRQLGLAWLVYPGAEHSRFTHSLGVFHLAGRVIRQLEDEGRFSSGDAAKELFTQHQREAVLAAALLHDVGHGPFSHAFEHVLNGVTGTTVPHEDWTKRIIQEEGDILAALQTADSPTIVDDIAEIIDGLAKPHYLTAIVSGQLDVDRFDYLLRDSLMTGSQYGRFDLEWMLRTLAVRPVQQGGSGMSQAIETIVVDGRRGLDGLEAHLIGRHYMYRHVYFHKTIRAAELVLRGIFQRASFLLQAGENVPANDAFNKLMSGRGDEVSTAEYLSLDDFVVFSWIAEWARSSSDPILADLSRRLLARRLLKAIVVPANAPPEVYANNRQTVEECVKAHGYEPEFYCLKDPVKDVAYKGYFYNLQQGKNPFESEIWYLDRDNRPHTLSSFEYGVTTQARKALEFQNTFWFIPEDVKIDPRISGLNWL